MPFDPFRILLGLRQKWYWFLIFPTIFGFAGGFVGLIKTENRYSVSLQLLRAGIPGTVQASQEGTAFKPRELSDETLLAITYSSEVMEAVGKKLDPPRSGASVKKTVEINKQRGTDFFYLTAHSRSGPEDSIAIVNGWASEIVTFTRDLQRREARDMHDFLSAQLIEIADQLTIINKEILAFSEESEFYDADMQTESYLASLENLQMRMAEAKIELQSKEVQIERYREELRNQSPIFEELRNLEKELTFLQGRYTNENPLVKEKIYEISFLRERLEALRSGEIKDLKEFTGSELGNNLYLEILALENERIQLRGIVDSFDEMIVAKKAQVAALPKMQMGLRELNDQRNLLLNAQSLLDTRKKEAEFYMKNPPGYWKIFQTPELGDVAVSSQPIKILIFGAAGVGLGGFIALCIAILWELRQPGIRSPLQGAIVSSTRPVLHVQIGSQSKPSILEHLRLVKESLPNDPRPDIMRFWLTELARPNPPFPSAFFQVVENVPQINEFWSCFLGLVEKDDIPVVLMPLDDDAIPMLSGVPVHGDGLQGISISRMLIEDRTALAERVGDLAGRAYVLVVAARPLRSKDLNVLNAVDRFYTIIAPEDSTRDGTRFSTDVIHTVRKSLHGLILITPTLRRTIPRFLYSLQMFFFQNQAREDAG